LEFLKEVDILELNLAVIRRGGVATNNALPHSSRVRKADSLEAIVNLGDLDSEACVGRTEAMIGEEANH
jgi:hypothetical protein